MAVVTGFTAEHMQEIEDATIVDARIDDNDLVLIKYDESEIVVGSVFLIAGQKHVYNRQTADYTLVYLDKDKFIEMDSASANDLTIPDFATVAFPAGTVIPVVQRGAGITTIVPDAGVTIHNLNGLESLGQYARFTLEMCDTDEWYASGDLTT